MYAVVASNDIAFATPPQRKIIPISARPSKCRYRVHSFIMVAVLKHGYPAPRGQKYGLLPRSKRQRLNNIAFLPRNDRLIDGGTSSRKGRKYRVRDLNEVYVFAMVVEQKGFSAAARTLKLPKSSISRYVGRLERRLGMRLLE